MDVFSSHRLAGGMVLDPATVAVVVVDMVNDFCKPGGLMVLPGYERLVPPQLQVIEAAREHGTYQILRKPLRLTGAPFGEELKGNVEIKSASVEYRRRSSSR